MNIFASIILGALLAQLGLELGASLANLGSMKNRPPRGLEGLYEPEEYKRSQDYLRHMTYFQLARSAYGLVIIFAFWFSGGFNWLDQVVRSWVLAPVAAGIVYIGILGMGQYLLNLPFELYHTFVLEERFGFNRTTSKIFVTDRLKGFMVAAVIGLPLLAAVLAAFDYTGAYAWIYIWAMVGLFSVVMQYIAPSLIMPLFNKFSPLEPGELRDSIFEYARSVDFPLKNVLVMDSSKRTGKSNAFFTGFGANKRIALFDTLIEKHTPGEIVAVLAHEIGHYKKKHTLQAIVINILNAGIILFVFSIVLNDSGLYTAFYMQQQSVYSGLVFFGLLYMPAEMVLSVLTAALSRHNEYQADRFSARTIRDPGNLVKALKKLASTNLSNLNPHPFYVILNYSHPPVAERLKAIEKVKHPES